MNKRRLHYIYSHLFGHPLAIFGFFALFNFLFRFPHILEFGFLNEDAALLLGSAKTIERHGFLYPFFNSYGPDIIRPFQMLGFALQHWAFGADPFPMHLINLALFSLSQTILFVVLRRTTCWEAALFGTLLLSVARAGAEPLYWLSDQHDQILFFSFALGLLTARRYVVSPTFGSSLVYLVPAFLLHWVGFLSNEKGTVVPVLLTLWTVILLIRWSGELKGRASLFRAGGYAFTALLSVASYFFYRFSVLGTLIGGYDDRILPPEGFSFEFLANWTNAAFTTPMLQASQGFAGLATSIGFLILTAYFVWSFTTTSDRKQERWLLLFFLIGLGVASLPTYRLYGPPFHIGVFSTRMYWLPLMVWAVGLCGLLYVSLKSAETKRSKTLVLSGAGLLLILSAVGGRTAARQVAEAHVFTEQALMAHDRYCHCVAPKGASILNLPIHFRTVNVFTEKGWLEQYAKLRGTPECKSDDDRCLLFFRSNRALGLVAVPRRVSPSSMQDFPPVKTKALSLNNSRYRATKRFPKFVPKGTDRITLQVMFVKEVENYEGDVVALYLDNKPIMFTTANVAHHVERGEPVGFRMAPLVKQLPKGKQSYSVVGFPKGVSGNKMHVIESGETEIR